MTPRARRILTTSVVGAIALLIALTVLFSSPKSRQGQPADDARTQTPLVESTPTDAVDDAAVVDGGDGAAPEDARPLPSTGAPEGTASDVGEVMLEGLHAAAPEVGVSDLDVPAASLGSLDPREAAMLVEFSRVGAGIARITMSEYWLTAKAKRQADAHYAALAEGKVDGPPLPEDSLRYVLKEEQSLHNRLVPVFAAHSVVVNGTAIDLFARLADGELKPIWAEVGPGQFQTVIVNEAGQPVLAVTRHFVLGEHGLTLLQRAENLTEQPLDIQWRQFGPSDLEPDRARYLDRRRFRFGYLQNERLDPGRANVLSTDRKLIRERSEVIKQYERDRSNYRLWPNQRSLERDYELSWFGSTNRYFALVVHPVMVEQGGGKSMESIIDEIQFMPSTGSAETAVVFTFLHSPEITLGPGGSTALDMGIFAGPMDRKVLGQVEPYKSLGMQQIILYMMSTFCAICTFQWLADVLMAILTFLRTYVLFDWGLAIIGLVVLVRALLHPITKRSQINMMRFSKQMQAMKPEIDRLQKKFDPNTKDGRQKLQQEQMRLFKEHGVNPFQMLGCLPMFLQFPIWVALYAMLYFAWDIRHEPAFFGIFQLFGNWPFLADLSTGDHFFGEFSEPLQFLFWNLTGINLLPILMGVVMFIHQKYMTPPSTATMTPEQLQQQKIMRVMVVGMLPLFLYNAPSGLTLYILTSSIIGIVENKYVRAHVDQMDLAPKAPVKQKKKRIKDRQGRAYADALERAKAKREQRNKKTFKKKRGK